MLLNVVLPKANGSPHLCTWVKKKRCGWIFRNQDSELPGMGTAGRVFPGCTSWHVQLICPPVLLAFGQGSLFSSWLSENKGKAESLCFSSYALLEYFGFSRNSSSHLILQK